MKLIELLKNIDYKILSGNIDIEVEGIEYDSRKILDNYVFIAMIGTTTDGHKYISSAIDKGAKVIIVEKNIEEYIDGITYVYVSNIRHQLGFIASNYYGYPQDNIKIIGITGTNGKTTSTYILENILENTARIGTTGYRILDKEYDSVNTTPESLELIKLIKESVDNKVKYFIMEVSSHALKIGRVDMLEFESAIFTNLTQDHLDFHLNMDDYFNSKKHIIDLLKENAILSINKDDKYCKKIMGDNIYSFSIKDKDANLYGEILKYTNEGMNILIKYMNKKYEITVKLLGEHNLYNILGVISLLLNIGYNIDYILDRIKKIENIPGRFESIKNDKNAMIIVDYAHTPDGIKNVIKALKNITKNSIISIIGAGGDRDSTKRPLMSKAAALYSDYIILTSDNPRTEEPINILKDLENGLKDIGYDKYIIIENREDAIKKGIELLNDGDSLLIAGKGHENYQIIGTTKYHFDDKEIVNKYLKRS